MKKNKINIQIKDLMTAAMLMAIGMILPFFTGQIPQIGRMLLPMHIPVLICGLVCGWQYGGLVGFILPLLRYAVFGMPPVPSCISMAFELASYGIIIGALYSYSRWKCMFALYRSLIVAMLGGRIIWGMVSMLLMGLSGEAFTWQMFLTGAFLGAFPGIILQLIFIPAFMAVLNRAGAVRLKGFQKEP